MSGQIELQGLEPYADNLAWGVNGSLFPLVTPQAVDQIAEQGFGKLGYAFDIESPAGNILAYVHKENPADGISSQKWGIPTETVMGLFVGDKLIEVETIEDCLVRCLEEEQAIDLTQAPDGAALTIDPSRSFRFINWPMGEDTDTGKPLPNTFSIAVALHANMEMTQFIAREAAETEEALRGTFIDPAFLGRIASRGQARHSTDLWLASRQPRNGNSVEEEAALHIKSVEDVQQTNAAEWRDLRFTESSADVGDIALLAAAE